MTQHADSPANRALVKALSEYNAPTSELGRKVRDAVASLDKNLEKLGACFAARARGAVERQQQSANQSSHAAMTALRKAQAAGEKEVAEHGNLSTAAQQNIAFYEGHVETVKLLADQAARLVAQANAIEQELLNWHNLLTKGCVDSLWDDDAIDRAITIVSAGAAIAAFVPNAALAAAVVAAGLAAGDLKKTFVDARKGVTGDVAAARLEGASVMIAHANQLTIGWLHILGCK